MKILVTGGSGLVGKHLKDVLPDATYLSSKDVNLLHIESVDNIIGTNKPDIVVHLAARVGGVLINSGDLIFGDQDGIVSIPSKIVLLTKSQYKDIALEASSLPGIGKSTPSVEELESSIATTGIPIFFASFIAIASLFVSTTKSMSGMFFISLIPPRDRFNFWCSFSILSLSFFVKRES